MKSLLLLCLFLLPLTAYAQDAADDADRKARPCMYDERFRQFDFWAGTWEVHDGKGQLAGTNTITPEEGGCVLVERWTGSTGGTGMSLNYYDPGKDRWVQKWVAAQAYIVDIEGGLRDDGAMHLAGELIQANGTVQPFRGTWTPLDDGRVRQFFEVSQDDGATWQPWFDGYYTKQE